MHTLPLLGDIADNLVTKHAFNKSLLWGALPTVVCGISYLVWYEKTLPIIDLKTKILRL